MTARLTETAEQNKALVRRFVAEVLNNHGDLSAASTFCAPDFIWHGGSVGDASNLESYKELVAPFFRAFPDMHATINELLALDSHVICRYTWRATHTGPFMGIEASQRPVAVDGMGIYRVKDGRIAEEWWQEDLLGLLQQISSVAGVDGDSVEPSSG